MTPSVLGRWGLTVCVALGVAACEKKTKQLSVAETEELIAILDELPPLPPEAPDKELVDKIYKCWIAPNFVTASDGPIPPPVKLRIFFNLDGTLKRAPEVLSKTSSERDLLVVDSALRAVYRCAPYKVQQKWLGPKGVLFTLDARNFFN